MRAAVCAALLAAILPRAAAADPISLPSVIAASTAEAPPPSSVQRVDAPPARVPVSAARTRLARNPLTIEPRRVPERRVFEAMRLEPWMRGGRVGVRMSASF